MVKIYLGEHDEDNHELKLGYTEQTCWARCKNENYTIFAAVALDITAAEILFVESYVRLAFNAMTETVGQIRTDYFLLQKKPFILRTPDGMIANDIMTWGFKWLFQFVREAAEIINTKRAFSKTPFVEIRNCYLGYVRPYSY